jgi:hypothetical protein
MEYRVEDLPQFGVILVPPSVPEFAALLADIQKRIENPVAGSPPVPPSSPTRWSDPDAPAMVLRNNSQIAIAALAWIWKTHRADGRAYPSSTSMIGNGPSLLAPFGFDERLRKLYGYWHVVLPGSKRLIRDSELLGDNSDVRPPEGDEIWKGGIISGGGGGRAQFRSPVIAITLALDGVFFVDGGFAGPDSLHNFDPFTAGADGRMEVAKIARDGHNQGLAPGAILEKIEAVTGPGRRLAPPPPPPMHGPVDPAGRRRDNLQDLADQIAMMRQHQSDDSVIYTLMSWTETPLPNFRRL